MTFDFVDESFTVSLWYRADASDAECPLGCLRDAPLVSKGRADTTLTMGILHERLRFQSVSIVGDPIPEGDGVFHHVVGVVDRQRNVSELYLDGVLLGRRPPAIDDTSEPLRIGGHRKDPLTPDDLIYWSGVIDDVVIWNRALPVSDVALLLESPESLGMLAGLDAGGPLDTDGDGMPDNWEMQFGLDATMDDADADPDDDGLSNLVEYQRQTHPGEADSDADGLNDGIESGTGTWVSGSDTGTNPLEADTDGDGLLDGLENPDIPYVVGGMDGSDPNKIDTDGDGHSDDIEFAQGSDPGSRESQPSLRDGLVAYWPFDGRLIDFGESRLDGVEVGEAAIAYTNGRYGQALAFNGSQAVEVLQSESALNFSDASFAISLWYRADPPLEPCVKDDPEMACDEDLGIVSKGLDVLNLHLVNGKMVFHRAEVLDPIPIGDEVLHHLVGNVDIARHSVAIYIDGQLVASAEPSGFNSAQNRLYFGAHPESEAFQNMDRTRWVGLLDDVVIWERPLIESEIAQLATGDVPAGELLGIEPAMVDPTLDTDGDGMTDAAEFIARTNPNDASSWLHITAITRESQGGLRIAWSSTPGTVYGIDYGRELDQMETLGVEVPSQGEETFIVDNDFERVDADVGYYRVRVITVDQR